MPLSRSELEPLLRLALVRGVGPHRLAHLVTCFGSAVAALRAPERELRSVAGIGPELARRIRAASRPAAGREVGRALRRLDRLGAFALTPGDPLYPEPFRSVQDPPFLLFGAGNLDALRRPAVAVVGTRSPTEYGREVARSLGRDLALAGYNVVSGLARGIDQAAQQGAVAAGTTTGILGHGIDQVYPPENRELFAAVCRTGLLLTEYPPGETPKAGNFPRRNRLIAALSEAVVVVEMAHRSGAQHTVTYALEQGKEVMAVPGRIDTPTSEGTNQLIRDGARLVTSATDVLEELEGVGSAYGRHRTPAGSRSLPLGPPLGPEPPAAALALMTDEERHVLTALGREAAHVDTICTAAGLSPGAVLATLLELELRGLVRSLAGNRFVLSPAGPELETMPSVDGTTVDAYNA